MNKCAVCYLNDAYDDGMCTDCADWYKRDNHYDITPLENIRRNHRYLSIQIKQYQEKIKTLQERLDMLEEFLK